MCGKCSASVYAYTGLVERNDLNPDELTDEDIESMEIDDNGYEEINLE
jgi:hypothetical protein